MALIQCPECGKEISDKALSCPYCGNPMAEQTAGEQADVVKIPAFKRFLTKKNIIIAGGIAAIIVIALIVLIVVQNGIKRKEALAAAESSVQEYNSYVKTARDAASNMFLAGSYAYDIGWLVQNVWHDSIFDNKFETDTTKYVRGTSDFNEAIKNVFKDSEIQTKDKKVTELKSKIDKAMKLLKNPPEELKDFYDSLMDFYDCTNELVTLGLNPTGSYQTYPASLDNAVTEFSKMNEKINAKLPEEISVNIQ